LLRLLVQTTNIIERQRCRYPWSSATGVYANDPYSLLSLYSCISVV